MVAPQTNSHHHLVDEGALNLCFCVCAGDRRVGVGRKGANDNVRNNSGRPEK